MEVQRGLGVTDLLGWFEPAAEDWQASRDLLEMIDYRVDNLLEPTVLTGEYHLILCRNVLLYFPIALRRKVFGNLSRHCAKDGHLILGAGETVIGQTDDFVASRIFKGSYDRRPSASAILFSQMAGRYRSELLIASPHRIRDSAVCSAAANCAITERARA